MDFDKVSMADTLKLAKDGALKKWDVEFVMGAEIFYNLLDFLTEVNTDVPMKFFQDRIMMHHKSPDNIQYAEVIIPRDILTKYQNDGDGDNDKSYSLEPKIVLVSMKNIVEEMKNYIGAGNPVKVRIDTSTMKRIEFHFGAEESDKSFEGTSNIILWARLMDPKDTMAKLARISERIRTGRENPNIKKATIVFEPMTFQKIVNLGGKGRGTKSGNVDTRFVMQVDKGGIIISSGDKLEGRIFRVSDTYTGVSADAGTLGTTADIGTAADVSAGVDYNAPVDEVQDDSYGLGYNTDSDDSSYSGEENDESYGYRTDDKKDGKKDKKKKVKDDKEDYKKAAERHQLLLLEADKLQYVSFERDYMKCFLKLKGLSFITVEVRTNSPVVVEQKVNDIKCLLTIAPRVEDEDDYA